jgi:pimeloyl-ACP methyl ester carboxylesterase
MTAADDSNEPETYRELVRRRNRKQRTGKRLITLVLVFGGAIVALVFWMSHVMVSPPRCRVSESARSVIGVVLRDSAEGVEIVEAVPPASTAGLRRGDHVVRVDDEPIESAEQLESIIESCEAGWTLQVEARRPAGRVLVDVEVEVRTVSPGDLGLEYQEVAFNDPQGLVLRGWYVPPPASASRAPAIAFGHGNASDRRHWLDSARQFHDAGFAQLLLDFSGRGDSQGEVITLGAREAGDLMAALEYLSSRPEIDDDRLFLVGRSMGAAAAALAAGEGAPVRALALDSPYADLGRLADEAIAGVLRPAVVLRPLAFRLTGWRTGFDPSQVSPIDALRKTSVPVLILHGTADEVVPIEHSRDLAAAAAGPTRLVELPGQGHNDPRGPEVIATIIDFLRSS